VSPSKTKSTPYVLLSTVGNLREANKIARFLVEKKLAACVNILPNVKSIFRWQNKLDQANELLLLIKTEKSRLKKIETAIQKLHSYSVPEIIGFEITKGFKPYLEWLFKSVS